MPERLDWVTIETGAGNVQLPWRSRDLLLEEIRRVEACKPAVKAFEAVGASRPVLLDDESKAIVAQTIDVWMHAVGAEALPPGVWELRNALYNGMHDSAAS